MSGTAESASTLMRKIIKAYLLKRFPFCTEEYEGTTYTNLLIPRRFFNLGEIFGFLSTYHYLGKYKYISYRKRPHYKGGTYTTIHIDKGLSITEMCDYIWSEVVKLLATHKNLLSS
jgi:hypothetical protein